MGKEKNNKKIYVTSTKHRNFIEDDDNTYEVFPFKEGEKLKKDRGYVKGKYVFVYRGKKDRGESSIPGSIYKTDRGEYEFIQHDSYSKKIFDTMNIITVDIDNMINNVKKKKEQFITKDEIEMINTITDVFKPTIYDDDDFLTYIIKKAVLDKEVVLKLYRDRVQKDYDLNNLKTRLVKKGSNKMTPPVFNSWCELLGLKWTLTIEDDGSDNIQPLKNKITITSSEF